MSIYPVYLCSWFPKRGKSVDKSLAESAEISVRYSSCLNCKGKCTWKKAWGHHSLPWGYGNVWCSKKCLKEWRNQK